MLSGAAINLDANASYGVLPEVIEGIHEALRTLNPSSIHGGGQRARAMVELARDRLAGLLGLSKSERIIFTSGATEANTSAILAPFLSGQAKGSDSSPCWVTSAVEHHSVLEPCRRLGRLGYPGVVIPAPTGFVGPEQIEEAVTTATRLVTVMYGNNETGHRTPLAEVVAAARLKSDCSIHIDAVQHLGKSTERLFDEPIDSASFSAHKIGGLTGVGALVVRSDSQLEPLLVGGAQELRYRAGTENVAGIVAFGIAADVVRKDLHGRIERMWAARRFIEDAIRHRISDHRFNHPLGEGLPNTLSVTFGGLRADDLIVALDLAGVLVSAGAACASGKPESSHVLKEIGLSDADAQATVRISVRADHTPTELERAVEALTRAVELGRTR